VERSGQEQDQGMNRDLLKMLGQDSSRKAITDKLDSDALLKTAGRDRLGKEF